MMGLPGILQALYVLFLKCSNEQMKSKWLKCFCSAGREDHVLSADLFEDVPPGFQLAGRRRQESPIQGADYSMDHPETGEPLAYNCYRLAHSLLTENSIQQYFGSGSKGNPDSF